MATFQRLGEYLIKDSRHILYIRKQGVSQNTAKTCPHFEIDVHILRLIPKTFPQMANHDILKIDNLPPTSMIVYSSWAPHPKQS